MSQDFSYRHLHYFWVVAHEGGIARAAERLGVAIQTVSAQVRELERTLGVALLRPAGRGLALTDAGVVALRQADQIFQLGAALPAAVRGAAAGRQVRLAVGIAEGLPKLVVQRLLQPVLGEPNLRLVCHEDRFDDLLAALALHRLDVVLADRAAPPNPNLRVYSHPLGAFPLAWYAPPRWRAAARKEFPQSLAAVPVLLPSPQGAMRARLDHWFAREGVQPHIVGEFDDSALLKTFAAAGMGVFPAVTLAHEEMIARYGVARIAEIDVEEHLYAIGTEKKVVHPLVQQLLA